MTPTAQAALEYAARGLRVVPLHGSPSPGVCTCPRGKDCGPSAGKHPRVRDWPNAASGDSAQVADWYARWPDANVGVALGSRSGVVAIDVDSDEGEAVLAAQAGGDPPRTWTLTTGKGRRLLYAIPDGIEDEPKTTAVQDQDGDEAIRYQGDGGQCVMPPSVHPSGRRYAWVPGRSPADVELAPMPAWLIKVMAGDDKLKAAAEAAPPAKNWTSVPVQEAASTAAAFNLKADWWADVLEPAGWKRAGVSAGVQRYCRPGKDGGVSATVGHTKAKDGTPALHVFSGSVAELPGGHSYDKFGAYARLAHGGDFGAAARALAAKGYGPAEYRRSNSSAKLTGSNPSETPNGSPEWPPLVPLTDPSDRPPPFPVEVLPASLADFCLAVAEAIPCPVDFPATFLLAAAAGAVGATWNLRIKPGFTVPASVYACVVASPSSGKTPALEYVAAPIYAEQARLRQEKATSPAYVSDVTVEKLAQDLSKCPRGLTVIRDELAGWVTSMNQYKPGGAGSDRQFYLAAWSGSAYDVRRKNPDDEPVHIGHPRLSVLGGLPPAVLQKLRAEDDDGFVERLLFAYPPDQKAVPETWRDVPSETVRPWARAYEGLRTLAMDEGEYGPRPGVFNLTEDAKPVWTEWTRRIADLVNVETNRTLAQAAGKVKVYAARLALVLTLLDNVAAADRNPEVDSWRLTRGVALAEYYLAHARRVFAYLHSDPRIEQCERILRWVKDRPQERATFTRSELWQGLRKTFTRPEDLAEPLKLLCQTNHSRVKNEAAPAAPQRGRTTAEYEVNPNVLAGVN